MDASFGIIAVASTLLLLYFVRFSDGCLRSSNKDTEPSANSEQKRHQLIQHIKFAVLDEILHSDPPLKILKNQRRTETGRDAFQCLLNDQAMWRMQEKELKDLANSLENDQALRLKNAVENLKTTLQNDLHDVVTNVTAAQSHQFLEHLEDISRKMTELTDRMNELDQRLGLEPQKMEIRGFMKIETFGPALLMFVLIEIATFACVCHLFFRRN